MTEFQCSRFCSGSSPLARGTLGPHQRIYDQRRLIPARAGNTDRILPGCRFARPHPRSRGEHRRSVSIYALTGGSSPLARGTLTAACCAVTLSRLIPARAGNTPEDLPPNQHCPAHPRSRGEHASVTAAFISGLGSSPLARGTQDLAAEMVAGGRLIPARAGNTMRALPPRRPSAAHPRSRGEHADTPAAPVNVTGSSPLARGTQQRLHLIQRCVRLIPARAGNTTCRVIRIITPPAHPRSRGEHPYWCSLLKSPFGSSPLARGTQSR